MLKFTRIELVIDLIKRPIQFVSGRCEDRLFFGPPQLMLPLRFLARDTPHLFSPFRVGVNGKALNGRTITSSISDSIIVRSSDTAASSDSRGNSRNRIGKSNSNRTLRSRNGGLTNSIDSVKGAAKSTLYDDLPTRASMSAVVQPATIFSPEALLYEYLSAVAAHEGAHVSSSSSYSCFMRFMQNQCWNTSCRNNVST